MGLVLWASNQLLTGLYSSVSQCRSVVLRQVLVRLPSKKSACEIMDE
jgi:hypothetical protein